MNRNCALSLCLAALVALSSGACGGARETPIDIDALTKVHECLWEPIWLTALPSGTPDAMDLWDDVLAIAYDQSDGVSVLLVEDGTLGDELARIENQLIGPLRLAQVALTDDDVYVVASNPSRTRWLMYRVDRASGEVVEIGLDSRIDQPDRSAHFAVVTSGDSMRLAAAVGGDEELLVGSVAGELTVLRARPVAAPLAAPTLLHADGALLAAFPVRANDGAIEVVRIEDDPDSVPILAASIPTSPQVLIDRVQLVGDDTEQWVAWRERGTSGVTFRWAGVQSDRSGSLELDATDSAALAWIDDTDVAVLWTTERGLYARPADEDVPFKPLAEMAMEPSVLRGFEGGRVVYLPAPVEGRSTIGVGGVTCRNDVPEGSGEMP